MGQSIGGIMQVVLLWLVKIFITKKVLKALAAEVIEAIVESTDNTIDDKLAKPILDVLRG